MQVNGLLNKGIALERLGHLQARAKNFTGAIFYYEMALAGYPNSTGSTGLLQGIGDNLYQLGNYTEAIRYYDKALAREPNNVQIQQQKTLALAALDKSADNNRTLASVK
jgi:tetratricopeptide (TPR) repeat protein